MYCLTAIRKFGGSVAKGMNGKQRFLLETKELGALFAKGSANNAYLTIHILFKTKIEKNKLDYSQKHKYKYRIKGLTNLSK